MVTYTQANGDKYKYCKAHCDADSDGGLCADILVPGNLSSAHEGEWQKQNACADNNSAEKLAGADTKVLTGLPGNLSPIS